MATLKDFRDERLRKLEELKKLSIDPYPATSKRTHTLDEIHEDYTKLEGKNVSVAGRIVAIRDIGQLVFIIVRDASGQLQFFLKEGNFEKSNPKNSELEFGQIKLLNTGDFVEAHGPVVRTKTGEISIEVKKLRILTKTLRPLPLAHESFSNKEERFRRRYVDLNVNKDVYERFVRRSKFWQATRDFLNQKGFLEINIPVLEHTTGGADAKPFKTHMDVIDQDFYLRISHELPLKRLVGGGYEKVYDIGPRFRNEHYTDEHLPEHVAMEWYWAYADWRAGMELVQEMFRYVLKEVYGTLQFDIDGLKVDLEKEWEEIDYAEVIKKHFGIDVFDCTLDEVKEQLKKHSIEVEKTENKARGIDKLWKSIRGGIAGPAFLVNTPTFISPLSKTNPENPATVDRFQPIIAGRELGNGWSELNDPIDQLNRFMEQQKMRDAGDEEAQMLDIDYVEMLEYGMPPTVGYGHSERVFWTFEGVTAREGVPFPQLRADVDEVTKATYPQVFSWESQIKSFSSRPQDFSKRIVAVVDKDLEPWQVANAVAHMSAIIGNEVDKEELTAGDVFIGSDGIAIPRNSQYPIVIKRGDQKELHKLYSEVKKSNLLHHVFIEEMQLTTNDQEIIDKLKGQPITDTTFYGVAFFASNDHAEKLAKGLQLFK